MTDPIDIVLIKGGIENIAVAANCLKSYGIVPIASDLGGRKGRKLVFKTDSGIVFIKKQTDQHW